MSQSVTVTPDFPGALINRELSWLSFARRVLALAEDPEQPLLQRVKCAGIMGMIYDEDDYSAWDMRADGDYPRRHPPAGGARRGAQQAFIELSASS